MRAKQAKKYFKQISGSASEFTVKLRFKYTIYNYDIIFYPKMYKVCVFNVNLLFLENC